jgi:hypothetical protein
MNQGKIVKYFQACRRQDSIIDFVGEQIAGHQ